jgi:HlyD family secretion protein
MGACGLTIQFGISNYAAEDWTITIPNTESASYLTNLNAYNLARTERTNAIRAAEQELELAKKNEMVDTAAPRSEALVRAQARLRQASAQIASVQAQIDQHKLTAPFGGIITRIDTVVGESVGTEPIITMVSDSAYELIALIPEIDITRVEVGQTVDVVFDARQEETLVARVSRVSPLAREINGVSYFEATLLLETPAPWLRGGLNADIDIKLDVRENVLRIPTRFILEEDGQTSVLIPDGNKTRSVPVTIQFSGNDGFVVVEGLTRGDTVVAPD